MMKQIHYFSAPDGLFDAFNHSLTEDGKGHKRSSLLPEVGQVSQKMNVIPSASKPVKAMENLNGGDLKDPSLCAKSSPTNVPMPSHPNDTWLQVC